jgi:hypothetical protein
LPKSYKYNIITHIVFNFFFIYLSAFIYNKKKMATTHLDIKTRNVLVSGNLTVLGTTTSFDSTIVEIADSLIKLGKGNTANLIDLGVYAEQDTGTTALYSGYFKDATDDKFKFYKGLQVEPTTTVNTAGTGYTAASIVVDSLETTNIQVDVTDGTIDTLVGDLTLSAALNANVNVAPSGTGVIEFYSTYSFPTTDGAADGYVMKTDGAGAITWVDPSTLVGGNSTTASAVFATANKLIISENGGDREVVETAITITGGNSVSGISTLTANQLLPTCGTLSANTTLLVTDSSVQSVTTGATDKTITLPTDPTCGTEFHILKSDAAAGNVIITRGGSNTLTDGVTTSMTLTEQYDHTTLRFEDTTGLWFTL